MKINKSRDDRCKCGHRRFLHDSDRCRVVTDIRGSCPCKEFRKRRGQDSTMYIGGER